MPLIVHALGVSQSHIYHQWYLNTAVKPSVATVEVTPISMQAPGGHHSGMGVGERGVWGEGGGGRVTSVQTQDKLGTLYHIKRGLVEGVYMCGYVWVYVVYMCVYVSVDYLVESLIITMPVL